MKPQETVPLLTTLTPAALMAPPVVVGVLIGVGLLWLLSERNNADQSHADDEMSPRFVPDESTPRPAKLSTMSKRIAREDVAEVLAYGSRPFTRKEAVAALEALGFRKTAAYKALSPSSKFSSLIGFTPDGLIEWKG